MLRRRRNVRKLVHVVAVAMAGLMVAASAQAADHYIRQGATGNGSGNDWANACPGFTGACAVSSMVRGDIYWVADGSYGNLTLDRGASGSLAITVKKATPAVHGANTGWADSFGDGQASFANIFALTNY